MGPNPAEKGNNRVESFLNRPLSRRGLVRAAGSAAVTAAISPLLHTLYNRFIPNRPPVAEAAEVVKPAGVEVLGNVTFSPSKLFFVYKEGDQSYVATAKIVKDQAGVSTVEAVRLNSPVKDPTSVGTSDDAQTVVIGGSKGEVVKSTDGGVTWKAHVLPPEYEYVATVVPVKTVDQNPNRPLAVEAYNRNTGNPTLIMIYPDGAVLPVTNRSFSGFSSTNIEQVGDKIVYRVVSPTADYYQQEEISRNGNTATIEEKLVYFAAGVIARGGATEVFDKGERKLLVPTYVKTEDGIFTDPLNSTKSFLANKAFFPELANIDSYATRVRGVVKQDDSNWVHAPVEVFYLETASSSEKNFPAMVKFDIKDPSIKQRIPIEISDSLPIGSNGWSITHPIILQSGTERSMVIVAWNSFNGEQRFLTSPLNDTKMVFQHLPDVKVLQAPANKVFLPVGLNTLKN